MVSSNPSAASRSGQGPPPRISFALGARPDLDRLREDFARDGFVSVPDILAPDCALQLFELLRQRTDWVQVINSGERLFELDRATRAELSAQQRAELDDAVFAGARGGFQFRYETIRVPDDAKARSASPDPLAAFARWWSGGAARKLLRDISGLTAIRFADAQATAYSPGDFLTEHDDAVDGKGRLAAYVLNLTPQWRLEWGGLLVFHPEGEHQARALVPGFNRLNLFRVPRAHSVSEVTRAAAYRRYAVTGWLRR